MSLVTFNLTKARPHITLTDAQPLRPTVFVTRRVGETIVTGQIDVRSRYAVIGSFSARRGGQHVGSINLAGVQAPGADVEELLGRMVATAVCETLPT